MMFRQSEFSLAVVVCAWCQPNERGAGLGAISHGICPRHFRKLTRQLQGVQPKQRARPLRVPVDEALLPF
jgi:hypothetical protein